MAKLNTAEEIGDEIKSLRIHTYTLGLLLGSRVSEEAEGGGGEATRAAEVGPR